MNAIEDESPQKLRGGYYTDSALVSFLLRWILEARPRSILEPSAGDGAFIRGLSQQPHPSLSRLLACELDPEEAAKLRGAAREIPSVLTEVVEGDFLAWALSRKKGPEFDAVVGNPPFVRYQYLDTAQQDRAERLLKAEGLPFTRHLNAWVPFVVGSLCCLKPGGRLAMVVPSELLHVIHAEAARRFLLRTCSRILLVDPDELWFKKTLQGVILLLAERNGGEGAKGSLAVARMQGRSFLEASASDLFRSATWLPGEALSSKWMPALLTQRERNLFDEVREHPQVRPFAQVAQVSVGIVTGANGFFLVPDAVVEEYGLQRWARPMFGRSEHVTGAIYDERAHAENRRLGLPTNFLWFQADSLDDLEEGARRYVAFGESQGLHLRYKCRIRDPWIRVPSVRAAPVGMLKRCGDFPRLVWNPMDAFTTDTAYRVVPRQLGGRQLVYAFVNSLTALGAEMEGRHYGGGVLEMVPSEIGRLPIPLHHDESLDALDSALRSGLSPEVLLERQDRAILGALGLAAAAQDDLRNAWFKIRNRRCRSTVAHRVLD